MQIRAVLIDSTIFVLLVFFSGCVHQKNVPQHLAELPEPPAHLYGSALLHPPENLSGQTIKDDSPAWLQMLCVETTGSVDYWESCIRQLLGEQVPLQRSELTGQYKGWDGILLESKPTSPSQSKNGISYSITFTLIHSPIEGTTIIELFRTDRSAGFGAEEFHTGIVLPLPVEDYFNVVTETEKQVLINLGKSSTKYSQYVLKDVSKTVFWKAVVSDIDAIAPPLKKDQ